MSPRTLSRLERQIGPRPQITLVIQDQTVCEIWVNGRAPLITLHDYDWGETDPDPAFDAEGIAFSPINWRGPAWTLGLSLYPPEKETYTMANQTMKSIPLSALQVSKLNMRHGRKKPGVSDILPSIRQHGVRQSLLVRQEGEVYGVIAGRRRLFALKEIAKETGIDVAVPCIVMRDDSDAEALEASLIENVARLPATEMEQYLAFKKLNEEGRTLDEIGEYYGVTLLTVKRILALASLIAPIRKLYAEDEINRDTIRALTLASPDQQREWMRLFNDETEYAPRGRQLKDWIAGGRAISTTVAEFELESFPGRILEDLFGENGVFEDVDEFWEHQSLAIAAQIGAYKEQGWKDVIVLDRGVCFSSWEHVKRPRTRGGYVYVELRHTGAVTYHEGYIPKSEERRQGKAGSDEPDIKSEMSGPMATYVSRHRHLAAQAELLGAPGIALRLMVAHALTGSALWDVRAQPNNVQKETTEASLAASPATQTIEKAKEGAAALFKALNTDMPKRGHNPLGVCQAFSALLAMSDEEVLSVLTYRMAISLEAGGPVVEALLHVLGVDLAKHWSPEPAFFELLRDKKVINTMLGEVGSEELAASMPTETGKAQSLTQNS